MTRFTICKTTLNLISSNVLKRCYSDLSVANNHYDIIIAGGGMVGTTLACTLGKNERLSGKKILLLEGGKEIKPNLTPKYSNRVVALNENTYTLLNSIGAWPHIANVRYGTIRKMQVWEACSEAMITFNHDDLAKTIAYVVENDLILCAVSKEVQNTNNVCIINEAKIKSYKLPQSAAGNNVAELEMENGHSYTCDLLLGCDGANSQVRKAMGVQNMSWNYDQMGIVATLKLSEPSDNVVAWQRFLPEGVLALLPLNDTTSSLVWSITAAKAKKLLQLPEEQFVDAVNEAIWKVHPKNQIVDTMTKSFNGLLESLNFTSNAVRQLPPSVSSCLEGSRAAFPLGFGHATNYVGRGVALVGDAAHRVHPLAGQGVNLGFGDVTCLNKLLGEAVYSGSTVGNAVMLKNYESLRQRHNVPTMFAIDGLQKIFKTSSAPFVLLRSIGLQMTNAFNPLKKVILAQAAN